MCPKPSPGILPLALVVVVLLNCSPFGVALGAEKTDELNSIKLFDGKTLTGWHALPGGKWEVKDGVLVGTSDKNEKRHGLLISDQQYGDFVVQLKFRVVSGNSGFYFRSERVDAPVGVYGFQAEINNNQDTGGLYETGGRAFVAQPDPKLIERLFRVGEWNEMTVYARGGTIVVKLNDVETAHLTNDPGRTQGHFALQLHGGQDMVVMFKDIEVRKIEP